MNLPVLLRDRKRRALYLQLLGNGFAQASLAIGMAYLLGQLFDAVLVHQITAWQQSLDQIGVLLSMGLLLVWLRRHERIAAEMLGQRYVRELRRRFFNRVLNAQHESRAAGRQGLVLVRFVADMQAVRNWVSLGLARVTVGAIVSLLIVAIMALWHWGLALVAVSGIAASVFVMAWQGKRLRSAIGEARRYQGRLAANMTEKIRQASTVQLFDNAEAEQRLLMRHSRSLLRAHKVKAARIGELRGFIDFISTGVLIAAFAFCAHAVSEGQLTAGVFVSAMSLIGFLAGPMRDMGRAHEYHLAHQVALLNLRRLALRLAPIKRGRPDPANTINAGSIVLKGLTKGVRLQACNAAVPAGSRIALVGANGAGKSTLLRLLARLTEPDEGRIEIDGSRITRYTLAEQRKAIALVSMDAPLFKGSLRHNLTYGLKAYSTAHFAAVCKQCGLDALIARLPQGLSSRLGENAAELSQGERARVMLARALLRQPKILLLDEAEANLDAPAMAAVSAILAQFSGTVIMATHRREAALCANELWHLHGGHLIAQGPPESLLTGVGATALLFRQQLRLVS